MFHQSLIIAVNVLFAGNLLAADSAVTVTIEPHTVRSIGGVTEFNREQYITIHASPSESDMSEEILDYIENELEASYGRNGGVQSWELSQSLAAPDNPDMPDVEDLRQRGGEAVRARRDNPRYRDELLREVVLCTHPEYMVGVPHNDYTSFGPRSPEAAAEWVAHFLKYFYTDESRPKYYEVFNEPFVHREKIGATIEQMSEQHAIVARRIKKLTPDVMVGGYTAAWAEVEANNFEHWNNWQKKFMDIAGAEMDFFSTHFYDGINVKGTAAERTGSNTEAIIDMIDTYSHLSFGVAKPQVISEYGRIIFVPSEGYSPARDAQLLRSFNGMLMTFMDHPDRLIKTVPFILGVGEWTYTHAGGTEEAPYDFLLFRRSGEGYVTTELELFYRFWKGVHGQWREHASDDPDVRVHALADGQRLNVIFNNLDDDVRTVSLQGLDDVDISKVSLRTLETDSEIPLLSQRTLPGIPEHLKLKVGQSTLLMIDTRSPIAAEHTVTENRTYATHYLQTIEAEKPITFTFEDTAAGEGDAVLRLAIGRERSRSLDPVVTFNGTSLDSPTDWMGGDQSGRPMFFGMIEMPVPMELVEATNTVELIFPDSGGKVASAILQTNVLE